MISGNIAAPRFRLDNRYLLTAHIHALVLEIVGQRGGQRLPIRADELLDMDLDHYPLRPTWQTPGEMGWNTTTI